LITGARGRFGAATDSRTTDVLAAGLRAGDVFAADVVFAARAGVFVFFATRAGVFFSAVVFLTDVLRAAGFLTGRDDGVLGIAGDVRERRNRGFDAELSPVIARSASDEAI
jgi:hypothetical protein